jgi:hypothetical protein
MLVLTTTLNNTGGGGLRSALAVRYLGDSWGHGASPPVVKEPIVTVAASA